jgi:DNA-binding transcriptional ArsR family regulator
MSGRVVGWAAEQVTGSPISKLVLLKLADNANEDGVCWPSIGLIVEHTELGKRTVQEHLVRLESLGLIIIERRDASGATLSNVYRLAVPPPLRRSARVSVQEAAYAGGAPAAPIRGDAPGAPPVRETANGMHEPHPGVRLTASHIEEPPIEPSRNLLSLSPAGAGEREKWMDFRKAVAETWPDGFPEPDEAPARRQFERCCIRISPDQLVACARMHGAAEAERKTARRGHGVFLTKLPSNWLREGRWEGYVSRLGANSARAEQAEADLASVKKSLGAGIYAILRRVGVSESELLRMVGARYEPGPPPTFITATEFQASLLRQRSQRLDRELGKDLVIMTSPERRSA